MNLPRLAIKNPQFALTIVFLMVLVGIVSYFTMPRSEDPQFDLPITLIEVVYPGASSTDIESLVVTPLENEFSDIENIKIIETQVKNDGARIEVTFLHGTNPDTSFNQVKQAVATVKPTLPVGVQELLVIKATPNSVAIVQLALWSDPTNYKDMEYFSKQLEKRLEAISAVQKADIWGFPKPIVKVEFDLAKLQYYDLSITQVNQILESRAKNITPGFLDASTRRFNVKSSGNFKELSELSETIILSTSDYALRLKDVASVTFEHYQPSYLAFYKDKPVIFVTVEQRAGTNVFSLTDAIDNEVAAFRETLPEYMFIEALFKQSDSVSIRVNGFFENLWQGLILVGLMALLFLGVRESIVVILAIPLSFLIAIGWLDFTGFGLQQMSIVGLIIALGLLVDNAIVVTESIHREKKHSTNLKQAASEGTSKVAMAITSGTITTMLAFLPMLMLASDTGDFVRSMPVTVVLVLLASLIIATTLTPLLASRFFTMKSSKYKTLQHYINVFADKTYIKGIAKLIQYKKITILLGLLVLIGMGSLFGKVGLSLFPKAEKAMLLVDVQLPPNSALSHTQKIMENASKTIKKEALVKSVALNVGNSNPRIYYNEIPKRGVSNYGQLLVILNEYHEEDVANLVDKFRNEFATWPEATITIKEFTQGPVTDQAVTVRLIGESINDLEKAANDLEVKLSSIEGAVNIENPIGVANTELVMDIDYDKAGLSNIDIASLDLSIQTILSGGFIGSYNDKNGESYPIVTQVDNLDIANLDDINITNTLGEQIPLNQFAQFKLKKGHSDFFHYQKLRMAKVSADVIQGHSVNEITNEIVEFITNYDLPDGMYFSLGGEEEARKKSFDGLSQILIITAVGIFSILVLQFKSFLQPLIIFSSIPFAIAGSVIGLYLMGLSFSMMAFIGLISLFGIVVNNAIILIDTTNRNIAAGFEVKDAVIAASGTRFTPILLTTLTTIGGLLPLTLLGGNLWQPLGVVIISGLCVSAISSFLLVPVLTEIFTKGES